MADGVLSRPESVATDLLQLTTGGATRDTQTVTAAGVETHALPDGVRILRRATHIDDRGSLVELYDPRWEWHPEPLVYAYSFTIRPGVTKGWALHREHEDRYFVLQGQAELVLYDVRPDSSTRGAISRIRLSDYDRCLVNIPRLVWHATRNLGTTDWVGINFPTVPYDHANPDKYRLPLDTPLIPFSFEGTRGW
jgi:dTDP-4-dehydrorhamnose 3,5-epimerase